MKTESQLKKMDLSIFKEEDIYSISMFLLYELTKVPEFTVISELPYILERKSMLKLCQYFGGKTIKIPTIEELSSMTNLLLLYQYVNLQNIPFEDAIKLIGYNSKQLLVLKNSYNKLCEILNKYNIKPRENYE